MNNCPVFTIIVPIFNAEKYVMTTLQSLKNQLFNDYEVILVDDGSTDSSGSICEEFSKKDKRYRYIKKLNSGVSSARNVGMSMSRGEYLLFVDSDDWVEPNLLSECYKLLIKKRYDMIIFGMNFDIEKSGKVVRSVPKQYGDICIDSPGILDKEIISLFNSNYISSMCNKVISRRIVQMYECKFNESVSNYEDLLFSLSFMRYAKTIYCSKKTFYHYILRDTPGNARKYKDNYISGVHTFSNAIAIVLDELNITASTKHWFKTNLQFVIWACIKNICRSRCGFLEKIKKAKLFLTQSWIAQIYPMCPNGNKYNDICVLLYKKQQYALIEIFNEIVEIIRNLRY